MINWQGIPTTRLTLGGEVMVPRDNSTLAFSTELLNYIISTYWTRPSPTSSLLRPDKVILGEAKLSPILFCTGLEVRAQSTGCWTRSSRTSVLLYRKKSVRIN